MRMAHLNSQPAARRPGSPPAADSQMTNADGGPGATNLPGRLGPAIAAIHASPHQAVLYTTGGGAPAIAWLLGTPGASATVLEARVPYGGDRALAAALGAGGGPPTATPSSSSSLPFSSAASREAATALAVAAYRQAAQLAEFGTPIVGVGGAGALATGRARKGGDRFWVATHDGLTTTSSGLAFARGAGVTPARRAQDEAASALLVDALARACGVGGGEGGGGEGGGWEGAAAAAALPRETATLPDPLAALLSGAVRTVELSLTRAGGVLTVVDAPRAGRAYLPGSFNPWHGGHGGALAAGAAAVAAAGAAAASPAPPPAPPAPPPAAAAQPLAYELAVVNADKGMLSLDVLRGRVAQFLGGGAAAAGAGAAAAAGEAGAAARPPPPLLLTREPLFAGKARLLAPPPSTKTTWVVGWDTAARLVDPKYYGGSEAGVAAALADLSARGCVVAVVGRRVGPAGGGAFRVWDPTADVPPSLAALIPPGLFVTVPEEAFRADVSSTELREQRAGGGGGGA
jgi:hypothetical protein